VPDLVSIALSNILSPMVLFFALGFAAALARSDLAVPEAVAKALALYLMLAIGFKGGAALSEQGLTAELVRTLAAGAALSFAIPFLAFTLLRLTTRLKVADAAAVAAHYGSISVVTFVAGSEFLNLIDLPYQGYMVAVMAIMETPAIVAGLWLARRGDRARRDADGASTGRALLREILLNASVVLLLGAFAIGWITGAEGLAAIAPFIVDPFKGVLCLFLLDMGLIAAQRWRTATGLTAPLFLYGVYMPVLGAGIGLATAWLIGLGPGEATLLAILAASASYIAVPAAMRLALPEANPSIYLTLSLAVTFPFNLTIGIPLYFAAARITAGG
jgi:hypothetical protein